MKNIPESTNVNETERLQSVKRYQQIKWRNAENLNNLVKMVSRICDSPIAYVSLIDDSKQVFIAQTGLSYWETSQSESFCRDTIRQNDLTVIEDASKHPVYQTNPYVLGDPFIRFYAGMPVADMDGNTIGTLCVIDREPRTLSSFQLESLRSLRHHIIYLMELRMLLETVENEGRIIADSTSELQEKYDAQTRKLAALAQFLSHQVSGPVASIKGLMYLINTLPQEETKEYMTLLNLVVDQMDMAVRQVTEKAFATS